MREREVDIYGWTGRLLDGMFPSLNVFLSYALERLKSIWGGKCMVRQRSLWFWVSGIETSWR